MKQTVAKLPPPDNVMVTPCASARVSLKHHYHHTESQKKSENDFPQAPESLPLPSSLLFFAYLINARRQHAQKKTQTKRTQYEIEVDAGPILFHLQLYIGNIHA